MGELQNVPASTGGFLHSQNWNFPEEGFILSSSCNSAVKVDKEEDGDE
jgi:hypothetical protein